MQGTPSSICMRYRALLALCISNSISSLSVQLVWIVVFLATVLLGVDIGLGVGVSFSLLVIVIRTIL